MNNEKKKFSNSSKKLNNSFKNDSLEVLDKRHSDAKSLDHISSKINFMYFKNDILKDLKVFEKNILNKYNNFDMTIKDEMNNINKNIDSINSKLSELSTLVTVDNIIKEQVYNLENLKKKILENIAVNEIKINNLDKETKQSIINMNKLLKETVIYQGLIGSSCKFKTFHDLIDFILNELFTLDNYKDKNIMDLSSYKKKLDTIIQGFKLQIDIITKSSTQFTLENFRVCDKKINELSYNFNDKIEKMQTYLDKNIQNIIIRLDDLKNKIVKEINELKNDNSINVNNFNSHIKEYLALKEDFKKINDIERKFFPLTKKNSLKILEDSDDINKNINSMNKSNFKKMKSFIKKDTLENININNINTINSNNNNENKNNDNNNSITQKTINNNDNNNQTQEKLNDQKTINKKIKSIVNSKVNLNIKVNNSNLSENSLNIEKNSEKIIGNQCKKLSKQHLTFSEKNTKKINNLLTNDMEEENEKRKIKSPDTEHNGIKSFSKLFSSEQKVIKTSSSNNSPLSQKTHDNINNFEDLNKSNNLLTEREIKRQTIKLKTNKNMFNKNRKKPNENNNIWFSDTNKYKYLSIGNNTVNNKLFNLKKSSSGKFKNIIITLEGTKKMIIDCKDLQNGKNIYHIESLNNSKKYPKLKKKERLPTSKPYFISKKYFNSQNGFCSSDSEDLTKQIKNKNTKVIYLKKSESHNILMDNRINKLFLESKNLNQ